MKNVIEEEKLTAYVLGELSAEERVQVEAYLQANPASQLELESIRQSTNQLKELFSLEMDSNTGVDVGKILLKDSATEQSSAKIFNISAFWKIAIPAVAAAVLFFVVPNLTGQESTEFVPSGKGQTMAINGTTLVGTGQKLQLNASGSSGRFNRTSSLVKANIDWDSVSIADSTIRNEVIDLLKAQEGPVISCLKNFSTVNSFVIRVEAEKRLKVISENSGFNHCVSQAALGLVEFPTTERAYDIGLKFIRE